MATPPTRIVTKNCVRSGPGLRLKPPDWHSDPPVLRSRPGSRVSSPPRRVAPSRYAPRVGRPRVEDGTDQAPTVTVAPGRPAREALWGLIRDANAGDPLTPVTVVVPTPNAGPALRRTHVLGAGLL